ncbi:MAG: helix-turn-helix transcriptional regulator [Thiobacillus sp.]|nr:helix-turn-helix transcriptional regulator [Thiobacillus sp.]
MPMHTLSASTEGQNADATRPLIVAAADVAGAHVIDAHCHPRGQLLYAAEGTMQVSVGTRLTWMLTPRAAVWVPCGAPHQVSAPAGVSYRSVFVSPYVARNLLPVGTPWGIDQLTREIILEAARFGEAYRPASAESRLLNVLHDRLRSVRTDPLPLSLPHDPRARRVCVALLNNPADDRSLERWGKHVGASSRTLTRVFQRETGLNFTDWVQRMRLSQALDRLAEGQSVTSTGLDLGYASPSAFCAMFRRVLGTSPGRYFH